MTVLTFDEYSFMPTPAQIKAIYDSGFQGVIPYDGFEAFHSSLPRWYDEFAAYEGSGAGKFCAPYKACRALEPTFGYYEKQTTGDCVSHGTRNAGMIDYCYDALFGETKYVGRFATENIYGWRGHGGQGANCGRLCEYTSQSGPGGFLPRARYQAGEDLDEKFGSDSVDLSKYNSRIGHNWGRPGTPSWLNTIANKNSAARVWRCKSVSEARDALYNGFGLCRCWSRGFSSKRDEYGGASVQGRWAHAESWIGCDDTSWAHSKFGGPRILEQNSWGKWNSGPIYRDQPEGSYWFDKSVAESILRAGATFIIASVRGFERKELSKTAKRRADNVYESG